MIVDDDVWIRTGRETALARYDNVEVVASLSPLEAMSYDWVGTDVAVVDAHDPTGGWDHYPGVGVVEAIRRRCGPDQTTVIVISGRIFDPMLRLRMAEAGADYFYAHLGAPSPDSLVALLQNPSTANRASPGNESELATLGLRTSSRPNEALKWIREADAEKFFTEAGTQKTANASRRTLSRVRDEVARLAQLDPALADRERRPGETSWRDVTRFVQRALGRRHQ